VVTGILQIVIDTNILVAAFRSRRGASNLLLDKLDGAPARERFDAAPA
jgi:predicted nucleic acid-binding protein